MKQEECVTPCGEGDWSVLGQCQGEEDPRRGTHAVLLLVDMSPAPLALAGKETKHRMCHKAWEARTFTVLLALVSQCLEYLVTLC